jgi:hypothetical protein
MLFAGELRFTSLGALCRFDILIEDAAFDLSPLIHPPMSRVLASFEPWWLGDATGRGAEPSM